MSTNINNQYDFFKNVNIDADGNIGVVFSGGTGGGGSAQPFLYTADNYTDLGTVTGMGEGDLAYVANSEGTSWLPATVGGTYYPQGIYVYVSGTWTSDRNAISLQLELNKEPSIISISGKKDSAGTIAKGLPVYLVGFDSDVHTVEVANANSSTTMPVIGFTSEPFNSTDPKNIITFGKLEGVNTTSAVTTLNPNGETWAVNDALYMSTTTGGLTKVRPTGSGSLIQRIAKVLKVDATGGQIFVFNTARTAGLPNLSTDNIWVGDANGIPQEVDKSTILNPSVQETTSTATLTPNADEDDQVVVTALATNMTIAAPSGTPVQGQKLIIRIEDNGTGHTLTWNTIYEVIGVTLPTTTTANKKIYVGCIYNSNDSKWDVVAVKEEV